MSSARKFEILTELSTCMVLNWCSQDKRQDNSATVQKSVGEGRSQTIVSRTVPRLLLSWPMSADTRGLHTSTYRLWGGGTGNGPAEAKHRADVPLDRACGAELTHSAAAAGARQEG
jgi:hypothetical protein